MDINVKRIERFKYSGVTNAEEYLAGVQDEKTWRDIERLPGNAQARRYPMIANSPQ